MGRTVYPDYDFVNNGKFMHFGTFVRKEHNGEKYLIPVVRHFDVYPGEAITQEQQDEFIKESEVLCEKIAEKYIVDEESMKIGTHNLFEKEDGEEDSE